MTAEPTDETTLAAIHEEAAFRVHFWSRLDGGGLNLDAWRVTGADVHGVLDWAHAHAGGRELEILVESLGHVEDASSGWEELVVAHRILGRNPASDASACSEITATRRE